MSVIATEPFLYPSNATAARVIYIEIEISGKRIASRSVVPTLDKKPPATHAEVLDICIANHLALYNSKTINLLTSKIHLNMKTFVKTKPHAYIFATLLSLAIAGCGGGSTEPDGDFYAVNLLKNVGSACVDNLGSERGDAAGLNLIAYYGTIQAGVNMSFLGNGSCAQYAEANHTSWGVILTADQYRQIIVPAVRH